MSAPPDAHILRHLAAAPQRYDLHAAADAQDGQAAAEGFVEES